MSLEIKLATYQCGEALVIFLICINVYNQSIINQGSPQIETLPQVLLQGVIKFILIVHSFKVMSVALHVSAASLFPLSFSSFFSSLVDHYNLSLVHKLSQTQVLLIPSFFNKFQSIKPGFATEGLSCLTYICQSQGLKKLSKRLVYDTCI